ncbi:MAG TPA: BamA/TamA family outer membrane protein [Ignavibacteriaceae bacterium]|nr:BamA/TamA family outer membrane protein [Ignavibacteriaceae bacterium]
MKRKNNTYIYIIITAAFLLCQFDVDAQSDSLFQYATQWEAFPIINYDSDVGFGYGGKTFFYNFLDGKESFDLILYNSTKGERWYRFVFSEVDIQRRHGRKYLLAVDLIADYDKWINYKFYSKSYDFLTAVQKDQVIPCKREVIELTALLSKGFTKDFVAELGARFKSSNSFGFTQFDYGFAFNFPYAQKHVQVVSLIFNFRWDTRTNYINPQSGFLMEIDNELAHDILNPPQQNFYKFGALFQSYLNLFIPGLVFANRFIAQGMSDVNYQLLLPLGGNNTLRGLPLDRYLNTSSVLINSELRFPIWWRFGAVAGADMGNGSSTPEWIFNPVAGLRFYMDNFVVRFDCGFGEKNTRIYFNFGHIF